MMLFTRVLKWTQPLHRSIQRDTTKTKADKLTNNLVQRYNHSNIISKKKLFFTNFYVLSPGLIAPKNT